jgi:Zn-dependent protease with chaperone function
MLPFRLHRLLIALFAVSAALVLVDETMRWAEMPVVVRFAVAGVAAGGLVFLLAYFGGTMLRFTLRVGNPPAALHDRAAAVMADVRPIDRRAPVLTVFDQSSLHAFAVNDGRGTCVFISSALVGHLSPRELAGVLAHECGHISEDHPVRLAVVLAMLASVKFSVDIPLLAAVVVILAYLLMMREWEYAADQRACQIVRPQVVIDALTRYRQLSRGDRRPARARRFTALRWCLSEILSAHPASGRRMRELRRLERATGSSSPNHLSSESRLCTTASSPAS